MGSACGAFQLRPAGGEDFQFAWSLYRDLMKPPTVELLGKWNEPGQKRVVELALVEKGTSVIVIDGLDAGWLQVGEAPDSIYLGHLYLVPSSQNRGIGTAIVRELRNKAQQAGKALSLDVMKNNRARLLYERLEFRVIGESEYKLKMRWQENAPGRSVNRSRFTQRTKLERADGCSRAVAACSGVNWRVARPKRFELLPPHS